MTDEEIMTELSYNDLYTYINFGTPQKKLKVTINFHEKSLVLLGLEINRENIFNESNSKTYKSLSEINIIKSELYNGYISEDVITLNNIEKSLKIQFILGKELYEDEDGYFPNVKEYIPIKYVGYIGLSIDSMFRIDFPDSLPIYLYNNYKYEYNFKSQFSIIFDKVKDKNSYKGKLVLNAYPHDYNKDYNEKQYISSRLQKNSDGYLDWCIALDNVYYANNIIDENNKIIFRPEIGIIVINVDLFKYLSDNYFKEYIDKKICKENTLSLLGENFKYYFCSKEIDITKFKDINFELKDINMNFTLNYMDIFYEYNNKYFFLMVSRSYKQEYIFGSIIMKKYDFVFDKYKSKIGVYNKNINNNDDNEIKEDESRNNIKSYILLIVFIVILCILIILVIIYIIWSYLNKPRIQRKNELNDDYIYKSDIIN